MSSTGVQEQSSLGENATESISSRVQIKSFDFQASSANRQSLQTLQFSATHKNELVSKNGPIKQRFSKSGSKGSKPQKKKSMIKPSSKPVEIFCDPSPPNATKGPVSAEEEALQLMSGDNVPETYWKMLAEERRAALDDSLHENEVLHKEIENLKEENSRLTEIAGQAEFFATILQTAIEGSSDEDGACAADNSEVNEKVESYLSSYEVISLTDEQDQSFSDAEEAGEAGEPNSNIASSTDSDTNTLHSATPVKQIMSSPGSSTPDVGSESPFASNSDSASLNCTKSPPISPKSPRVATANTKTQNSAESDS